jgi:hypothetical protein
MISGCSIRAPSVEHAVAASGSARMLAYRGRVSSRTVALGVATVVLLAGCTAQESPADAATELLFSPSPTAEPTAEPTPTVAAQTLPEFPENCAALVPKAQVARVVAVPLRGDTTFVFADALPDIGRTARVTCGYGVGAGRGPGPGVEITVNEYESEQAAQDRVAITLDAAAEAGTRVTEQRVGEYEGWVLADRQDISLVVDAGSRTLVVTLKRGLVDRNAERVVLEQLAARALGLPTGVVEPEAP